MTLSYRYQRLQSYSHVRLIKILLDLTLDLIAVKLAQAPPYEAISYVWGTGRQETHLAIGNPVEGSLAITTLLSASLKYLIGASTKGYLWIDQICT